MKKFLIAFLLAFAAPIVAAKTVLVVGDSLSAAYNLKLEDGWVHLLSEKLSQDYGLTHHVINASISGDTTAGGLSRLPATLEQHQPDIVILELGANDGLRGSSLTQMKTNLSDMINLIHKANAKVILAGMQLPPNYGSFYTNKFHQVYKDLESEHPITLIPFLLDNVGGVSELVQSDGLHPTKEAQPLVLENVWKYLVTHLATETGASATSTLSRNL